MDVANNVAGAFTFNIRATDGTLTHDFPVTLTVSDYAVSVTSVQPLTILRGTSTNATVKVQSTGNFNGPVTVSCDPASVPGGVSCTPVTLTPPPNGFVTGSLAVNTTVLASVSSFTLTLDGDSAGATRTAPLQIDLQQNSALFDFGLAVTPSARTVAPGASTQYQVNILPLGGFNGTVNLTCGIFGGNPPGTSCSFDQASISSDSVAHLTVNTGAGTPTATYDVQVFGASGAKNHGKDLALIVTNADFTMTGAPGVTVTHGDATGTGYAVTLGAVNGFSSGVFLTCGGLPTDIQANADVTCSSGGATVPPGVRAVTFRAGSGTQAGVYNVQVVGYSLSPYVVHTIPVTLTVQ